MFEPTGSQRDAASAIFHLPDYRVRRASDAEDSERRIEVESTEAPGCPQWKCWRGGCTRDDGSGYGMCRWLGRSS